MAWVPCIIPANRNKNCGKGNKKGELVGLMILVVFGLMFFFLFANRKLNHFISFPWIFIAVFGIVIIVIIGMGAIASVISSPNNPYKTNKPKQENHFLNEVVQKSQQRQANPYKTQKSAQVQFIVKDNMDNQLRNEGPFIQETRYCSFCGVELEPNARFCQQCGSKLFS